MGTLVTPSEWSLFHFAEPKKRRGVVWEDAEAAPRPEPSCHHPRDDQEEGEEQEGTAASHTGDCGEEVGSLSFSAVWNWRLESLTVVVTIVSTEPTALLGK